MDYLEYAFTKTEYIGNAHKRFARYLRRCWQIYDPNICNTPYATVVQSSGFGKSRMLREFARLSQKKTSLDTRSLYLCVRKRHSTGYPKATKELRGWLFADDSEVKHIADRLKAVYYYAVKHWSVVQTEWLDLFTDRKADAIMAKKWKTLMATSSMKADPALAEMSEDALAHGEATSAEKSGRSPSDKLVILVIDEARNLLGEEKGREMNDFRKLRQALVSANMEISTGGGIFGVLVDTNPKIADLSNDEDSDSFLSYPPFVLADTMDANWRKHCKDAMETWVSHGAEAKEERNEDRMGTGTMINEKEQEIAIHDQIRVYKNAVTGDEEEAWKALQCMGRPMWYSTYTGIKLFPYEHDVRVVNLAANKLMLGVPPFGKSV
ncbi:hypothetical protein PC129_g16867 [Phytophthora cactorum]|nr:hypothetical protein Pcac1_g4385 [Phytophthora cactorum]KAG2845289.1 hypothetical protein PC113_g18221 [Phytophthora cactorum]KAG2885059.1 hypothetical protein PC114_g19856 [Phytophthora cactorum]KAG2910184.1 hypothetical protein PC117_g19479 [Phytophthora cactorum]KAG3179093.1 hypothetical protein PC128_g16090 [Phytophthora cactorum]